MSEYEEAYNKGCEDGYNEGYELGCNEGYTDAFNAGYKQGYASAPTQLEMFDPRTELKILPPVEQTT